MTPSPIRGKRKLSLGRGSGRSIAEDADRSATTGGGRDVYLDMNEDMDMTRSKKRKRSQDPPDITGGGKPREHPYPDPPNGNHEESYPALDPIDIAKFVEVIEREFSLEILLKNQERKTIEAERAKVEVSLKQLEQCLLSENATYNENMGHYQNHYGQYLEYGTRAQLQHNGTVPSGPSSRPQRNAAMKAARNSSTGNVCLAKNDRDQLVRVTCPNCNRYDFSNVQGFINHCRIAHKIEYASHDDAVRHCGVPIDIPPDESRPPVPSTRPGIHTILGSSSVLSGKLPETTPPPTKRKSSTSPRPESETFPDLNAAFNEFVKSPVTTRARATSFNSMFANGDFSAGIAGFSNNHGVTHPVVHTVRRASFPGSSTTNPPVPKRAGGSKVGCRRITSNGIPSPVETETTPYLKHLNKLVKEASVDYDIDGFVDDMRREKHQMMLLAQEESSDPDDSEVEEKADAKNPRAGSRRPAGGGRRPASSVQPVAGLVELPATRLRNRQQKEKEKIEKAGQGPKAEAGIECETSLNTSAAGFTPKAESRNVAKDDDDMLDIVNTTSLTSAGRSRHVSGRRRQSVTTRPRSTVTKPLKRATMEEQSFLSTLPLRIKNRRRISSIAKSEAQAASNDRSLEQIQDDDGDSDATSSDEDPGKPRLLKGLDGVMTPTSHSAVTGFVGPSCGQDAPNVQYVTPAKETPEIFGRPDLVDGSRYYVKRRIKIGNTSRYIPESKRSPRMAKYTHKWMIYFVSPPYSAPISTFLSSVTIFLDESFPLPRIIELRVPPFRWISYGWGEFNLHIRLAFCDPSKNKPMDVVHPLKLDPGKSGRDVTGYEGYFDVELDRGTQFLQGELGIEYDEVPKMTEVEKQDYWDEELKTDIVSKDCPSEGEGADTVRTTKGELSNGRNAIVTSHRRPSLKKDGSFETPSSLRMPETVCGFDDAEVRELCDLLEPYGAKLHDIVKKYPLVSETAKLPYSVASSNFVFLAWNIGRRKSVERHRARLIYDEVLRTLTPAQKADLSVKAIIIWCRQNQYGPPTVSDVGDEIFYCRYCGMIVDSAPKKGQKRSKSKLGVDAYCRCSKDVAENVAHLKTASSVQDLIKRNRRRQVKSSLRNCGLLSPKEIRALLLHTDVHLMRWVWHTVLQLDLSGAPSNHEEKGDKEERNALAVGAILIHATRSFLTRLVGLATRPSLSADRDDEADELVVGGPSKHQDQHTDAVPLVVTPIHILRAIRSEKEFDFLTNAGMATGSSQGG